MKKEILIPLVALLTLLTTTPVFAVPATKTPFTAVASFEAVSPGKEWITKDGISHIKGGISAGALTSISGPDISGEIWMRVGQTVDLNTGEGSLHGKWTITAVGGPFEGSVVAVITATSPTTSHISGTFIGHGSGDYEGQKLKGSFEGDIIMGVPQIEIDLEGVILSPKG